MQETKSPAGPAAFRRADERYMGRGAHTQCAHAGERPAATDEVASGTPVHYSTTFFYEKMDALDGVFARTRPGYAYARYGTPTNTALERALATLEGADAAISCGSGMAACHLALMATGIRAGELILTSADIYGASHSLIGTLLPRLGVRALSADFTDLAGLERVMAAERPRVVYLEVMTNPLLRVLDLPAIAAAAHRYGATVVVDNTFATPLLLKPFEHGADWVMHSLTKYLAGHGDVLGGVVLCRAGDFDALYSAMLLLGPTLGPQEAYLALRGLKTFPLRFKRQCDNAFDLARFLQAHPAVERVYYPGLPAHPQHALAGRLLGGRRYGALVSFELRGGNRERAFRVLDALQIILPATTLGDIYTTMMYPAHSSHRALSDAELAQVGIRRSLLRVSAGIEDVEDLQADLDQALRAA